jgi:hypothetical protein
LVQAAGGFPQVDGKRLSTFFKYQYPHVDVTTWLARMAKLKLLAKSISFQDPLTGRQHYFESGTRL